MNAYETSRLRLATRINAALDKLVARFTPRNALVLKAVAGGHRGVAVAHYMAGQASQLRAAYDEVQAAYESSLAEGFGHHARTLQAGAAAAEAMSNLLLAVHTGDKELAKATLIAFVNDAVDGGVVTV